MEKQWTTLQTQGKEITLIGTAHVSKVSAQQVKEALEEIQPDSICVELDEDRYQSLMHPGQWEQTDIVQVIKQKKTGFLLVPEENCQKNGHQRRRGNDAGHPERQGTEC